MYNERSGMNHIKRIEEKERMTVGEALMWIICIAGVGLMLWHSVNGGFDGTF